MLTSMPKKTPIKIEKPIVETRSVSEPVRVSLFVRAGGRCEFDGCNAYLLEHHVTLIGGNYAQLAHIVAFSKDGPRGAEARPGDINDIANLMLLCHRCHKLIDSNPGRFSRQTLEGYKKAHEDRVFYLTGLGAEQKTSIFEVRGRIAGQPVVIPYDQILEAVTPRYPISKDGLLIDLTVLSDKSPASIKASCETIREQVREFFAGSEIKKSCHISVFALGPIPLLAFLGTQLSSKVPTDFFQRHRDTEKWNWKPAGKPVRYAFKELQRGKTGGGVALILSLSGPFTPNTLPKEIGKDMTIYELTFAKGIPNATLLNTRQDLEEFRKQYQVAIATITSKHRGIREIHLLPAVPAPIAILCGRELLPKVHPALLIYDNQKEKGGFVYQLTINN